MKAVRLAALAAAFCLIGIAVADCPEGYCAVEKTDVSGIKSVECDPCPATVEKTSDGGDEEEPVKTSDDSSGDDEGSSGDDDPFEIRGLEAEERKVKTLGKKSLPPWWILHGIKLNGPLIDHGSYKTKSFSTHQQEKYGIDSEGNILDEEKFNEEIDKIYDD